MRTTITCKRLEGMNLSIDLGPGHQLNSSYSPRHIAVTHYETGRKLEKTNVSTPLHSQLSDHPRIEMCVTHIVARVIFRRVVGGYRLRYVEECPVVL